jgi:hypothetical protein
VERCGHLRYKYLIGVDYFDVFVDHFCEFFACRPVPLFFGWSVRVLVR